MELNSDQRKRLRDALLRAFPTYDELAQLLLFELDARLAEISQPAPLGGVVTAILLWAEGEDRLGELVLAARAEKKRNAILATLAQELGLVETPCAATSSVSQPASQPAGPDVDAGAESQTSESGKLKSLADFQQGDSWRRRMENAERRICRVEIPKGTGIGTGFLVAPDLVITNWHVAAAIKKTGTAAHDVGLQFDYVERTGKMEPAGATYTLAKDYLVDHSDFRDLDYALLRVNGRPGEEVIDERSGRWRGWLTPGPHTFEIGEPLLILQHPLAAPLLFDIGVVQGKVGLFERVLYTTHTQPGSSGSPVFARDWQPVAIHHYGQRSGNMGVSLEAIWKRFAARQFISELVAFRA